MNKVILSGRFTKEPEVRRTQGEESMAIARFTMAVDRQRKKDSNTTDADFISCVSFGKTAEFIEKYGRKGNKYLIEGRIQTGNYTNKDGQKVYTTDVVVEKIEFADSKSAGTAESKPAAPSVDENGFMLIPDGIEEELPFM